MKSTRIGSLASAALVAGLLLSGCQQDPGTAARVGDVAISAHDVDLLSDAMCEEREQLAEQGNPAAAPRSVARDEALMSLIRIELTSAFAEGKTLAVDNSAINQLADEVANRTQKVEDSERARLRELIRGLLLEQQQSMAIAASIYEAAGQEVPDDAATLIQTGRQAVLDAGDLPAISVNPRFASPDFEQLGVAGAALSEPVSEVAKAHSSTESDPGTEGLPANLRCG